MKKKELTKERCKGIEATADEANDVLFRLYMALDETDSELDYYKQEVYKCRIKCNEIVSFFKTEHNKK